MGREGSTGRRVKAGRASPTMTGTRGGDQMRRAAVRAGLVLTVAMTAAVSLMAAVQFAASAASAVTSRPAGPAALGSISRGQVVWGWGDSAGYHIALYATGQSRQIALL